MNYKIIQDRKALEEFVQWLPDLQEGEQFYLTLLARKKYATEESGMTNSKTQLKRVTATKERIIDKIRQMECAVGCYTFGKDKEPVPQEALALYIHPNPRSMRKAGANLLKEMLPKILDNDVYFNPQSLAMDNIQTSPSRKIFYDLELDVEKSLNINLLRIALKNDTGCESVRIVESRGGYHVLIPLHEISSDKKKSWFQTVTKGLEGKIDMKGDLLLPVVGCCQGGFIPKFV